MLIGAILLFTTSAIALLVILVVAFAHTVPRVVRAVFSVILLSLILWQSTIFLADSVTTYLMLWNHLVFLWPSIAAASFFVFIKLLQSSQVSRVSWVHGRAVIAVLVIATIIQLATAGSGQIFDSVIYNPSDDAYSFDRGALYWVYLAGLITILVLTILALVSSYVSSKEAPKNRKAFGIILATVTLAMAYGLSTNVLLPLITGSQEYIALGMVTVDILAVGFALSIVRHQFLDIRAYAFRAMVYLLTILLAALLYVGLAGIISAYLLDVDQKFSTVAILSLVTLIVAVSFEPLRIRFDHVTNRLFFRDYYDPQDVLDKLVRLLIGTVDLRTIKSQSSRILDNALNPQFSNLLLFAENRPESARLVELLGATKASAIVTYELEDKKYGKLVDELKRLDVAIAVRLSTKHEDLGFLVLGHRRSGADYSSSDKHFLRLVSDQLSIGLQNALRFQEIENFNVTLQQKVDDATAQLRKSNKRLKLLDETKDDFVSMASHQLRTPLTSVKGYISMVLEGDAGKVTPAQQKMLEQAFVSSQRMTFLIADLLNVSRLRTGKFVIDKAPVNLAQMVEQEVAQLKENAKSRDLTLTYNRPSHFPELMLDETKTRQVIMNFADNAIYYTPAGGKIEIKLEEKPKSIELTVTDNGIGIPRHEHHHLFTKFYRATNAKRARPDGTGLGLFMAKKVVVAQGGAIIFRSEEGKGSTFGFSFPKA